jgi:hypothetical protein
MTKHEYIVRWQRQGWTQTQERKYDQLTRAHKRIAILNDNGRPDLAPLTLLTLERRTVGQWEPAEDHLPKRPKR